MLPYVSEPASWLSMTSSHTCNPCESWWHSRLLRQTTCLHNLSYMRGESWYDAIYFTYIPHLRPNKPTLECNNVPSLFPCPNLAIYQSSRRKYVTTNTTYPSRLQVLRTVIYNHTYIPYLRLYITPCNSTLLNSYRTHPHGDTGRRR